MPAKTSYTELQTEGQPGPPYPAWILCLRLLVPLFLLSGTGVGFFFGCRAFQARPSPVPLSETVFTVGPGCIPAPDPPESPALPPSISGTCPIDDVQASTSRLGPLITPDGFEGMLTPQERTDAKEAVPSVFHWHITAISRNATCQEAAAAQNDYTCDPVHGCTVSSQPGQESPGELKRRDHGPGKISATCSGGKGGMTDPFCTVHYMAGEIMLAISPAWFYASSYQMLRTDKHRLTLVLVDGWDDCLPTPPANGVPPLDVLTQWMMDKAGRGSGFLARLPHEDSSGSGYWDVLDLEECDAGLQDWLGVPDPDGDGDGDGPQSCAFSPYTFSNELLLFFGFYGAALGSFFIFLWWSLYLTKGLVQSGSDMSNGVADAHALQTQLRDEFMLRGKDLSGNPLEPFSTKKSKGQPGPCTWSPFDEQDQKVLLGLLMNNGTIFSNQAVAADLEGHMSAERLSPAGRESRIIEVVNYREIVREQYWSEGSRVSGYTKEYQKKNQELFNERIDERLAAATKKTSSAASKSGVISSISRGLSCVASPRLVDVELNSAAEPGAAAKAERYITQEAFVETFEEDMQKVLLDRNDLKEHWTAGFNQIFFNLFSHNRGHNAKIPKDQLHALAKETCAAVFSQLVAEDASNTVPTTIEDMDETRLWLQAAQAFFKCHPTGSEMHTRGNHVIKGNWMVLSSAANTGTAAADILGKVTPLKHQLLMTLSDSASHGIFSWRESGVGGLNYLADLMVAGSEEDHTMGSASKAVAKSWLKVLGAASLKSLFIVLPLILPFIQVVLRGHYPQERGSSHYAFEQLPLIGKEEHMARALLILGFSHFVIGYLNIVLYVVVGWRAHRLALKMSLRPDAAAGPSPSDVDANYEPLSYTIFKLKLFAAWLHRLCCFVLLLVNAWFAMQFLLLTVIAVTVDPYTPFTYLTAIVTLFAYITITMQKFDDSEQLVGDRLKARWIERAQANKLPKPPEKYTPHELRMLIQDGVSQMGLTKGKLAVTLLTGSFFVAASIFVVMTAQSIFYANKSADLNTLISTAMPCVALLQRAHAEGEKTKKRIKSKLSVDNWWPWAAPDADTEEVMTMPTWIRRNSAGLFENFNSDNNGETGGDDQMRAAMLEVLARRVDNDRVNFEMARVMDKVDWVELGGPKLFTESEVSQMAHEDKEHYNAVYSEGDDSGKKIFYSLDFSEFNVMEHAYVKHGHVTTAGTMHVTKRSSAMLSRMDAVKLVAQVKYRA